MRIAIEERLKPFSHIPGAACLLPGTNWKIEAFPALIRLGNKYEIRLQLTGPVKGFTLEQDLEKNNVLVFGHAQEGFYRLRFQASLQGIEAKLLNAPEQGMVMNGRLLKREEFLFFSEEVSFFLPEQWERLSLGVSKAQDWDLVWRRFDLREILPVLYGLGQKVPLFSETSLCGTGRLLQQGRWEEFCLAAFSHLLVPRLIDTQHQGFHLDECVSGDPSSLLRDAASILRALFFVQEGTDLFLLPHCPFPSGRLVQIRMPGVGSLDMEWASGSLRRVVLRSRITGTIRLRGAKHLQSCRIRTSLAEKGSRRNVHDPFPLNENQIYYLDSFHQERPPL